MACAAAVRAPDQGGSVLQGLALQAARLVLAEALAFQALRGMDICFHEFLSVVKPKHQPVALWFFVLALPGVPAPGLTYPLIGGASILKDQG